MRITKVWQYNPRLYNINYNQLILDILSNGFGLSDVYMSRSSEDSLIKAGLILSDSEYALIDEEKFNAWSLLVGDSVELSLSFDLGICSALFDHQISEQERNIKVTLLKDIDNVFSIFEEISSDSEFDDEFGDLSYVATIGKFCIHAGDNYISYVIGG